MPTDTSKQDPIFHLLGILNEGSTQYIENQERQGQQMLVGEALIPARCDDSDEVLTSLGFVLGNVLKDDSLFRKAILPEGWRKEGTSHSMWSKIVDEHGFERAEIFYNAAFYDRDAFMRLQTRIWVQRVYYELENRSRAPTLKYEVTVQMPGGNRKRIHLVDSDYPTLPNDGSATDAERHAYFAAENNWKAVALNWVQDTFPKWKSPSAYWSMEY